MVKSELRIGNLTENGKITAIFKDGVCLNNSKTPVKLSEIKPIEITEDWLRKAKFKLVNNPSYIGGKQYILTIDNVELDGIGTHSFKQLGTMVVCVVCKGWYVCNNIRELHELQNLYYTLTNKELKFKKI